MSIEENALSIIENMASVQQYEGEILHIYKFSPMSERTGVSSDDFKLAFEHAIADGRIVAYSNKDFALAHDRLR